MRWLKFLIVISLCSCTSANKKQESAVTVVNGKDVYGMNCLSCHATRDANTLYHPSLSQMAKLGKDSLESKFKMLSKDSVHADFFVRVMDTAEKRVLIEYIVAYKEQAIIY